MNLRKLAYNSAPQFNTTVIPFIADFTMTSRDNSEVKIMIPPAYDIDN